MISLYVHVPFCAAKCGYCSFYSVPTNVADASTINSWLEALALEARCWRERLGGDRVKLCTLYIGGGTPSVLSLEEWRRLLAIITGLTDTSTLVEATVEANPCSLTPEHLAIWRDSFITRVSLGIQSLDDHELRRIGRLHDAKTALLAMERVNKSGLSLSADLIFGLPGQTLRSWSKSLHGVLNSGARHISTYQLTLEPDTPMGRALADKQVQSSECVNDLCKSNSGLSTGLPDGYPFYRYTQWFLPKKGLIQYEISNFAQPGLECRHNLAYWRQENVLALGPAAWGYLDGEYANSLSLAKPWRRYANPKTLEKYFAAAHAGFSDPLADGETLTDREHAIEFAILAFRTRWGINRADFMSRFGAEILSEIEKTLSQMPQRLIYRDDTTIALTPAGMRVGNAIWSELS